LKASETAVVFIDLQKMVVGRQAAPRSAASVVQKAVAIADRFRAKGSPIIWVRVDLADFVQVEADQPSRDPNAPPPPADASELVPELNRQSGDVVITKRYWDAFWGTELEKVLRGRKIKTIVLGGIATNIGVESTARSAAALGFNVVIVEDATASMSAEAHQFAVKNIFPRLGRVRTSEQIQIM
jgi:nicotinamidase-related amidase